MKYWGGGAFCADNAHKRFKMTVGDTMVRRYSVPLSRAHTHALTHTLSVCVISYVPTYKTVSVKMLALASRNKSLTPLRCTTLN